MHLLGALLMHLLLQAPYAWRFCFHCHWAKPLRKILQVLHMQSAQFKLSISTVLWFRFGSASVDLMLDWSYVVSLTVILCCSFRDEFISFFADRFYHWFISCIARTVDINLGKGFLVLSLVLLIDAWRGLVLLLSRMSYVTNFVYICRQLHSQVFYRRLFANILQTFCKHFADTFAGSLQTFFSFFCRHFADFFAGIFADIFADFWQALCKYFADIRQTVCRGFYRHFAGNLQTFCRHFAGICRHIL